MSVVRLRLHDHPPVEARGGTVAVGNFDGVHLGHSSLIAAARRLDRGPVVAVTFDPHPLALLAPEKYQPPLTTLAERARLLQQVGADHVVILATTAQLLALSPEDFFDAVLRRTLGARGLVEGFNFRFGRDRAGSNDTLRTFCEAANIEFREVPAFNRDGRPVSSSRVRAALMDGDVGAAADLLDRPYRVDGIVGTGARRGRTIGFPTANMEQVLTILPGEGVYAVAATLDDRRFAGAANIGTNPTFGENVRKIEVHLIDFEGDLYGRALSVDFIGRLRETRRFAGPEALVEQLQRDVAEARRMVFEESP